MRKRIFISALPAMIFLGCNAGKAPLPEDKMADLLVDLHLAEVRATQVRASDSIIPDGNKNTDSLALYYREVLQHHGLDTAEFRQTANWYTAHPVALDSVYKKTILKLEKLSVPDLPKQPFP